MSLLVIIRDPLVVLDQHVAFSSPLNSWQPTIVGIATRSGALSIIFITIDSEKIHHKKREKNPSELLQIIFLDKILQNSFKKYFFRIYRVSCCGRNSWSSQGTFVEKQILKNFQQILQRLSGLSGLCRKKSS